MGAPTPGFSHGLRLLAGTGKLSKCLFSLSCSTARAEIKKAAKARSLAFSDYYPTTDLRSRNMAVELACPPSPSQAKTS